MNRTPRTCDELGVCHGRKGQACTCQHDTETLPPGGYYFAPGVIDPEPPLGVPLTGWERIARDCVVVLAVAGLIGFALGVMQAKGWPL